jgi:predicted nucleic acid-binding protein
LPAVVSDTGPLSYLVQIGAEPVLPVLFEQVYIPQAVFAELTHPGAPGTVRSWVATLPGWLTVTPVAFEPVQTMTRVGLGEYQAIHLAQQLAADALLTDDRDATVLGRTRGLTVFGTLGILDRAAQRSLIDLATAFHKLEQTNFRTPRALMAEMLIADARRKQSG